MTAAGGREFVGDEDLDEQARRWLEGTANVRWHGTTGERPAERFERDERALLARPKRGGEVRQVPLVPSGHVHFGTFGRRNAGPQQL